MICTQAAAAEDDVGRKSFPNFLIDYLCSLLVVVIVATVAVIHNEKEKIELKLQHGSKMDQIYLFKLFLKYCSGHLINYTILKIGTFYVPFPRIGLFPSNLAASPLIVKTMVMVLLVT